MIVVAGAALVLPDRILTPGTLTVDGDRIVEIASSATFNHQYIVPGFIDVHVHGVEGFDTLDEGNPVVAMAALLPRYGVTAFCPTTVACTPEGLARMLRQVGLARETPGARGARVLPAHLESNFISPEFRGAQPTACLRQPPAMVAKTASFSRDSAEFSASDILTEIERAAGDVGIVTLAPELEGGLELIRRLTSRGIRVSLGHSGATFEQGLDGIEAGARHATHLFNRMPPLGHRSPGLAGAVLHSDMIAAEVICDGYHVHPTMVRMAVAVKGRSRVMAISDGTAVSGLPIGTRATLGGQVITAGESAALLDDGTLAGSTLTMDRAFGTLVTKMKLSLVDAAALCSTTPACELGLAGRGILARDAIADFTVLDENLSVVQTYVAGQLVYSRERAA